MTWTVAHAVLAILFATLVLSGGPAASLFAVALLVEAIVAFVWLVARGGVAARAAAVWVSGIRVVAGLALLAGNAMRLLPTEMANALFAIALIGTGSIALEAVVARRAGPTAFAGHFSHETDALLLLALSIVAVRFYGLSPLVAAAGLIHYIVAIPFLLLPEPNRPERFSRYKQLARVATMLLLIAAVAPFPIARTTRLIAGATAALVATGFTVVEAVMRARARASRPTRVPGRLRGLLRSVAVYHGVPFRHFSIRRFYSRFVSIGELAFDIGAHVGNRVEALRALGTRVVAVEPQPHCFALLKRICAGDRGVVLVQAACAERESDATLRLSSAHPTLSSLSDSWAESFDIEWDREISVATTTLDALIEQYGEPAFIKIDVEGFEPQVLAGLSRAVRSISVEFLPASLEPALESVRRIEALGSYRYNYSLGETMRFASESWLSAEELASLLTAMPAHARSGDIYAVRRDVYSPVSRHVIAERRREVDTE